MSKRTVDRTIILSCPYCKMEQWFTKKIFNDKNSPFRRECINCGKEFEITIHRGNVTVKEGEEQS